MQIASLGNNLHEMSELFAEEKKKQNKKKTTKKHVINLSSAELAKRVVKVNAFV